MIVDGGLDTSSLKNAASEAAKQEAAGYDALWTAEIAHDPFFPLTLAAPATKHVELGTRVAVAFARNPMVLANIGWDLQHLSDGRFILGLGSQIRPHITRRFSMEWSKPAARMREMVLAIHAIWDSWLTGDRLDFQGDFYTHTLMTPFFVPDPTELSVIGKPKIFLAAVGPLMTEVAGEVCDGIICHGFTTERYLREVTVPALLRGRAKVGKTMDGFEISGPFFVVSGETQDQVEAAKAGTRQQIAFYASTPAYKAVLELHGWGDLQTELNNLSKQGKWEAMGEAIDDDVLDAFAVVREPAAVAGELTKRFGDVLHRLGVYRPYSSESEWWLDIMDDLKAIN